MNSVNFKLVYRNILNEKRISIINLLGLSVGFASSILIFRYVHREFSYDSFHTNADRICFYETTYNDNDGTAWFSERHSLNTKVETFRHKQ